MADLDVTKIRRGAKVLVEAEFRAVFQDGRVFLRLDNKDVYVTGEQLIDIRRQPFQQGDRVRWYPPELEGRYLTGKFEAALRDRDEALVIDPSGGLVVAPFGTLHHENLKDPGA